MRQNESLLLDSPLFSLTARRPTRHSRPQHAECWHICCLGQGLCAVHTRPWPDIKAVEAHYGEVRGLDVILLTLIRQRDSSACAPTRVVCESMAPESPHYQVDVGDLGPRRFDQAHSLETSLYHLHADITIPGQIVGYNIFMSTTGLCPQMFLPISHLVELLYTRVIFCFELTHTRMS
ncbi:hypothetical protein BDV95DRAFT_274684 [Massariosphaeria phaeospora]|uniref:Uncharacterized protein n=1 Tax=Massariosphaeria phaeospora TaxID=100035 RepID=A0A7C8IL32_9PLEO|nr:hypothetical protein BDV95DRAFT_274684 [Massariosphaeria phaeospora]